MEPNKYILDSSVLVAFYYKGDVNHKDALHILESLKDKIIVIHQFVVVEVATVLAYKISKKSADNFVSDVFNSENIEIPISNIKEEVNNFVQYKNKMSFTDIALVSLAKKLNLNLITFDKQMISLFNKKN